MCSETAGTTAFPRALMSLSTSRRGIPLATRASAGSRGQSRRTVCGAGCRPIRPRVSCSPCNPALRVCATTNSRRRRCGAPTEHADTTSHSASNPRSDRSLSTIENASVSLSSAATFSMTTCRGRTAWMTSRIQGHPQRSSAMPSCGPATENGWQGNPPQMRSTSGRGSLSHHCTAVRTSSWRGTSGQ